MLSTSLVLSLLAAAPLSDGTVRQSFFQGAHLKMSATTSGCENSPGPYITIDGTLTLSGIAAKVILTNNRRFTHETSADVSASVEIVPLAEQIQIHKQPVLGGVGGNPWIYLQFSDGERMMGKPTLLGRCVQGLSLIDKGFDIPTGAQASVDSDACSNSGGPNITLSGELKFGGLYGHIILTNNAKFTHVTAADVVINVVIIPEGQSLVFAKQPPLDGAGGNPYIFVQFLDGAGGALGDYLFAGRCNQL